MKLRKCFKQAFNMVLHSKLRSWLTILGIVIGVASVIAIMSLGAGMEQQVNSRLQGLGADIITLSAGSSRSGGFMRGPDGDGGSSGGATDEEPELTRLDVQTLKGIPDILAIDTNIRGTVDVTYLGKSGKVSLTGVDQKQWYKITTAEIRDGRMLDAADQNVVVIGSRLADSYFDKPLGINKMITIEDGAYRVVGILDDSSTSIYMPISTAYQVLDDKETDVYDSITIKVKDEEQIENVTTKIEKRLMVVRHVTQKTKDFSLSNMQQTAERMAEVTSSMTLFLTAIAAVSLLVGAVGIANTMFTSVLEKTKDIGIMKAIGAKNRDIMFIFLFNAALIGLIGGIIGVLGGMLLSNFMPYLVPNMRMMGASGVVSTSSIVYSLLVSASVGIIAGVIPAYKGSKLKPVDALRYE